MRQWNNRLHEIPNFRWWKYRSSACFKFRFHEIKDVEDVVKLNGVVTKVQAELALKMFELLSMSHS